MALQTIDRGLANSNVRRSFYSHDDLHVVVDMIEDRIRSSADDQAVAKRTDRLNGAELLVTPDRNEFIRNAIPDFDLILSARQNNAFGVDRMKKMHVVLKEKIFVRSIDRSLYLDEMLFDQRQFRFVVRQTPQMNTSDFITDDQPFADPICGHGARVNILSNEIEELNDVQKRFYLNFGLTLRNDSHRF